MKKYLSSLFGGLMALVSVSTLMTSCSITDPTTDLAVRVAMPPTGAVVGGQIKDSMGRLVTSPITISISGQDAPHIVDLLNQQVTTLTTTSGFVVMAVNDTIPVSADDPVKFTITVESDNYFTASKLVTVDRTEGVAFEMRLLSPDIANLPDGLEGDQETAATDGSGATSAPVNLTPPPNESSGATGSVNIPAGTRFLDEDGNPLTGEVTLQLILGDLRSDTLCRADEYFPGGRNNYRGADSSYRYPLSFFMLSGQDASGRSVGRFDPYPEVTLQVPGGAFNPITETNFAAGDTVFLSRRTEDGTIEPYDQTILTGPDGNGNLTANFTGAGVSGFAGKSSGRISSLPQESEDFLDYHSDIFDHYIDSRLVAILWPEAEGSFDVTFSGGNLDPYTQSENTIDGSISTLSRTSNARPALSVDVAPTGEEPFRVLLSEGGIELDLTGNPWPTSLKTVTYHVYGKMPEGRDPAEIRVSGLAVAIADAADTSSWRSAGSVQQGQISIDGLTPGNSYYLKGTYTFRGQTRTANTPWTREITATTDTLQYWYQLSEDEADEYDKGG